MSEIVDYAYPLLQAAKHLRKANDALVKRNMEEGADELMKLITEVRMALHAVRLMTETNQEKDK